MNKKTEAHLPATTKAQLMRQMLVQKERGFIQVLHYLEEWQTPFPKLISSFCHGKGPTVLMITKT